MPKHGVLGNAAVVGLLTTISRVLGMVRDIVCASFFGASLAWDVFVIAFMIPNMFRHLFGEGALSSAFIPAFVARKERESLESAGALLNRIVGWMISLLGTLVVLGMAVAYGISHFAPDPKLALISETVVITLPYLLLICLTAIIGSALNGMGRFISPAAAPILLNIVLIASAFMSPMASGVRAQLWILSGAVLVGGVLQLAIQVPSLSAAGIRLRPSSTPSSDEGLREILRAFVPAVVGLGVIQINEFCDNLIAELLVPGDGAVSAIYYGNRLNQLPLGVIGFSVATAAFPKLSSDAARGDMASFAASLSHALRLSLWVAIPAAAGLVALSPQITALLFQHGKFDAAATARTAPVVFCYAIGIPFYAANMVLTRAFYSLRDMKTPVRVSLTTVLLNLILNVALVLYLAESGIALATSITGVVNFVLLQIFLRRRVASSVHGGVLWAARSVLAAAAAATAAYALYAWGLPAAGCPAPEPTAWRAIYTGTAIAAAVAIYFAASTLLRLPESRELLAVIQRRRG